MSSSLSSSFLAGQLVPAGTPKPFPLESGEIIEEYYVGQQHSVAKCTIPPKKFSWKHYHPVCEESYFILSGKARVTVSPVNPENSAQEINQEMKTGDVVGVPRNNWHQVFNDDEKEDLVFLVTCVPAWTPECSVYEKDHQ
eukprot:TRINITY_DN2526_c0_g1_i1.p1 TRINITY_DN2526_c0_g1~~TRINITY_DN2526_c0_g1_i1.p1  ORF type:complete len:159 (-),score=46.72 TRINITY_DN2526_c0_g1_i1:82-501(-)